MGNKKSFILHLDTLSILDEITDEQAGQLFKLIYEYHNPKEPKETQITQVVKLIFHPFKVQFDRDLRSYESVCDRNKSNGEKGGRPKTKTQDNPNEPKKADSDSDSDSDIKNIYRGFIAVLNSTLKKGYRGDTKSSAAFGARLKQGYTTEHFETAIRNASADPFHVENGFKYLTPEFFCRQDKLEKFLNATVKPKVDLEPIENIFNVKPISPWQ